MTKNHEKKNPQYWTPIVKRRQELKDLDQRLDRPQDFHILGGGVAALGAAIEILSWNRPGRPRHSVTLYEASDRLGGRIFTKRLGPEPAPGVPDTRPYFERGAMRIPTSHDYTWAYAREAGLERRRFLNDDRSHDFGGKVYRPTDIQALAKDVYEVTLRPGEGPGTLYSQKVLIPEMQALDTEYRGREVWGPMLVDGAIRGPGLSRIDALSLDAVLNQRLTANEKRFVAALLFPGLLDRAFLMFVRSALTNYGDLYELCRQEGAAVVGGMDLLIQGMAEKIRSIDPRAIRTERVVKQIATNAAGDWAVTFQDGPILRREGRPDRHLLCTVPFSVFQHGDIALTGFENPFLEAVHGISYAHATKVALHVKRRFWEPEIKYGRSLTDRPSTSSYYPNDANTVQPIDPHPETAEHAPYDLYSQPLTTVDEAQALAISQLPGQPGPWPMLSSYSFGDRAKFMGRQVPAFTVADLQRVFPEVDFRDLVVKEGSETWYWNEKPLFRGPFTLPTPRNISSFYQRGREPHRGVFFAGDALSPEPGWIQGSLFSSLYALGRLLRAAQSDEAAPAGSGEKVAS